MKFITVKTPILLTPQTDLYPIIDKCLPKLKDGDILFVSSKIVAIHQGRCIDISKKSKLDLIKKEADKLVVSDSVPGHNIYLTIKDNILIPSAGIDESNANGHYILRPENPSLFAKDLTKYLKLRYSIQNLAVVITDSVTRMLRKGTINQAIGMFGMCPMKNYVGKKDIFGRNLSFTNSNILDSITAMAGLYIGEGNEQTPIVIGRDIPNISFTSKETYNDVIISIESDIYYPLLEKFD